MQKRVREGERWLRPMWILEHVALNIIISFSSKPSPFQDLSSCHGGKGRAAPVRRKCGAMANEVNSPDSPGHLWSLPVLLQAAARGKPSGCEDELNTDNEQELLQKGRRAAKEPRVTCQVWNTVAQREREREL